MRWEVLKIVEARDGFSANTVEQSEPKPAVRSFDAPRTFVNSSKKHSCVFGQATKRPLGRALADCHLGGDVAPRAPVCA